MRPIGIHALVLLLALAVTFSCSETEEQPDPDIYCSGDQTFVCDGDRLKICGASGRWALESCEDICTGIDLFYTGQCGPDAERGHEFCECVEECCTNGEQRCAGDDVEICNECQWTLLSCDTYCERYDRASLGCDYNPITSGDSCQCEGMDTGLCDNSYLKCEEGYVNICDSQGDWKAESCREKCEAQGYYYDYCEVDIDERKEVCHCTQKEEPALCRNTRPTCVEGQISVCENNAITFLDCDEECTALGLVSQGCEEDDDRGHDACLCVEAN